MISQIEMDAQDRMAALGAAKQKTKAHIARVRELMFNAAAVISQRGWDHDKSKFDDVEIGPLAEMEFLIARKGQAPFGSEEYERRRQMLGPMLNHHYAHNSHHPEHYTDGVDGMDLFDVLEMFFDWKAASERGEESAMNIIAACERFRVSPQLQRILENTADRLGYKRDRPNTHIKETDT